MDHINPIPPDGTPAASTRSRRRDRGFTLVELLIVVSILGVLATVSVISVRGITTNAQSSACDADLRTLEIAVEAVFANNLPNNTIPTTFDANGDGDTADAGESGLTAEGYLVAAGYLRNASELHDVSAAGAITATAGGDCA